MLLYSYSKEE